MLGETKSRPKSGSGFFYFSVHVDSVTAKFNCKIKIQNSNILICHVLPVIFSYLSPAVLF